MQQSLPTQQTSLGSPSTSAEPADSPSALSTPIERFPNDFQFRRTTSKRWMAIGLLGIGMGLLAAGFVESLSIPFASRMDDWSPWSRLAMTAFSGVLAIAALMRWCGHRVAHFTQAAYPPAAWAGVLAGSLFIAIEYQSLVAGVLTAGLGACLVLVAAVIAELPGRSVSSERSISLSEESPITVPEEDGFAFVPKAHRIADSIRCGDRGPWLIVGRYGSGKSSLTNLIWHRLNAEKGSVPHGHSSAWMRVRVSGWGLESPEARARLILTELCDELDFVVDTLALRDYCQNFIRETFSETHWSLRLFLGTIQPSLNEAVLHLDRILAAVDRRVILILDDFERTAESGDGYSWKGGVEETLDHLRHCKRMAVIVCVTKEALT